MRFLLFCVGILCCIGLRADTPPYNDNTFEVTLVGQDAALCAGQCTDYQIQITGGTGPYRLIFSVVGGSNFTVPNFGDNETVLRVCHDPTITGPFLDSSELPRVLRLPTTSLPFSVELMSATTDTPICDGTILFSDPFTVSDGEGISEFIADIPPFICDTLILPEINPMTPGVQYYTEPLGMGMSFSVGDTLTVLNSQLPNGSDISILNIFDPTSNCVEAVIPINLLQTPQINVPPDLTLCEAYELENFSGSFITPQAQYSTSRNFEASSLLAVGDSIKTSTTVYIRDGHEDINSPEACAFLDSFDVVIRPTPNTGLGQSLIVCSGESTIIPSLFDLLGGNPEPGGTWGGPMLPGIDFNDPINVDLSDMAPGLTYVFTYNISDPDCGIFSTELVFESTERPFPGTSTRLSICAADDINFLELLDNPDPGGFWNQFLGNIVDVGDGSSVDMTGVPFRDYQFEHSIIWFGCPTQKALLEIDLVQGINAGRDTSALVCWMETIDLNTLLSSDADANGTFFTDGIFPVIDGIWNTSAVLLDPTESSRTIEVTYIVDGSATNCPNDTAFIEVQLLQNPFAGIPLSNPIQVCENDNINLDELIIGADSYGDYFLASDLTSPIDRSWVATMDAEILYILPGTGSCLPDTAFLNLTIVPTATVDFQLSTTDICDNECVIGTVSRSRPIQVAIRILDNDGNLLDFAVDLFDLDQVVFCPGGTFAAAVADTIFLGSATSFDFSVVAINDTQSGCDNSIDLSTLTTLTLNSSYEETFMGEVCEGGSTNINGVDYDASIDLNLQSVGGCDSIIHIVIDTLPQVEGAITEAFCIDAGPQIILGQTFDRDTSELITFIGQATNGCDSIALVNLSFSGVATGVLDTMICDGSSIIIDGEMLQTEGTHEVDFVGISAAGCDSLTVVTLTFRQPAVGRLDTVICSGDSFVKGFDTYNENNLMATSLLQGSSEFGCDSLLEVNVRIAPVTIEDVTDVVCGDEAIIVNGNSYNAAMPMGTEVILNDDGCDSLVYNVALQVSVTSAVLNNAQLCAGESTGTFDIESAEGLAFPLEVFINGELVTTLNSLPATGLTGQAGINDISLSDGKCSYMTSIDLIPETGNTTINATEINTNNFLLTYNSDQIPSSVIWMPDNLVTCTDPCEEAEINIVEDTEVTLELILMNGCVVTATTLLTAEEVVQDSTFVIYESNIFDPEGADNSTFYIQSNEDLTIGHLSIYDRWGNLVFLNENFISNDPSQGWNGEYNSELAEQGVFVYRLEYMNETGDLTQRVGHITLVR